MNDKLFLVGADDVERAGRQMASAAETISMAIDRLQYNLDHFQNFLQTSLNQLEQLAASKSNTLARRVRIFKNTFLGKANWVREFVGEGEFLEWGVDHEEYDAGPGNSTCALVLMPGGKVDMIHPTLIEFIDTNNKEQS